MASARDTLREIVGSLGEQEALKILEQIRHLQSQTPESEQPALDPAIHLPDLPFTPLPPVTPVEGAGEPASMILTGERR